MDDIKSTLRKLKPFIGRKADGIWIRYNTGDKIEQSEWVRIVNLLAEKYHLNQVEETIVLPPPERETAAGEINIGRVSYPNHFAYEFGLDRFELTRHLGIFGSTGTGKTTLSKNVLRELIRLKIPFIVFDWEKNYRDLIEEHKEVRVFTVGSDICPFHFNYLKMPQGISYKEYVKNIIEVFNRSYVGGVGSDSVLLKVFDAAYREQDLPTTEDVLEILSDEMKGERLRGREMLWKQSSLRMLEFLSYGGTGDIFNVEDFYPIENLLQDQIIFELGALASSNDKRFFIEMFTLWYWLHKGLEGAEDERLKHVLVFEEFHNIVENSGKEDLVQKIFRQIRKYGTGLVIIDQTPSLIPNPVFENIYTKISFSLNHKRNVMAIADAMYMERDDRNYIGMLKPGQAICRLMGRYSHPFLIDVPFLNQSRYIADDALREHMRDFYKEFSPKKEDLLEIPLLQTPTESFTPSPLERIFLEDIVLNPFDGVDQRAKRLGMTPRDSSIIQHSLIEAETIHAVTIDRKKLFEITQKGEDLLHALGIVFERGKNQSVEHRYYLEKIGKMLKDKGYSIEKEKSDIDLVASKEDQVIAIEIETGKNNSDQIQKNFDKLLSFDAQGKWVIATTDSAYLKIQNFLSESPSPIQVFPAREVLKNPPL